MKKDGMEKEKNKKNKINLDELNDDDYEENEVEENNKKQRNKIEEIKLVKNKTSVSLYEKIKNAKPKGGILKKKPTTIKGFKKVGIKTINEENQQNEEESNFKETKEKEESVINDDYKPLPESDKEVIIVDYIIENVPNIIEIIKGLFNKDSMDISSLTIMFCCNLLRKIRFSKYKDMQPELIKCVGDYIAKEKIINQPLKIQRQIEKILVIIN